jgi:hypothetical protein
MQALINIQEGNYQLAITYLQKGPEFFGFYPADKNWYPGLCYLKPGMLKEAGKAFLLVYENSGGNRDNAGKISKRTR